MATRYIWVFPLASKHPPVNIIQQFLRQHGTSNNRTLITTHRESILARSKAFQRTCKEAGYTTRDINMTVDLESMGNTLPHIIRTDGGREFANQHMERVIHEAGYLHETTGPDSSSQNGLAERPHRTLKEKVRCLLYTAGLGIQFLGRRPSTQCMALQPHRTPSTTG
jgi:hypothetical protein